MADTKLFNIKGTVKEYQSGTVTLEKELQTVIENNMNIFFGVTFLASEYRTTDGGRMDSIGIDENHCPVIFEYKRSVKENVINQGLFYLNWLLDHKDSFKVLVIEKLGLKAANNIDWSMPRVVCVAGDFTKYDESAIKQMNRNISLIRYKKFGEDLLMFEQVNENVVSAIPDNEPVSKTKALIMIISKDYLKSVCCTDEWGAFYGKALHDKSCVIYPIIIDDSAPPALISQIKYLRFNGDEYASALSTLLRSLRKQFSK